MATLDGSKEKQSALETSVLQTLSYFTEQSFPMTSFEVWKWLWHDTATPLGMIDRTLADLAHAGRIEHEHGFWFLSGQRPLVQERGRRQRASIAKMHRASRFAHHIARLPWVQGVAVCNTLGFQHASPASDIDFLVLTTDGACWRTRLFVTGIAAILGQRPTASHSADTLCLSFFVSESSYDLSTLALPNGDPYLTYWVTQFTPLAGRGDVWQRFWDANQWVKDRLPNAIGYAPHENWVYRGRPVRPSSSSLGALERLAKTVQLARFPDALRAQAQAGASHVVVLDSILKFHVNDRRAAIRDRWVQSCASLGLPLPV